MSVIHQHHYGGQTQQQKQFQPRCEALKCERNAPALLANKPYTAEQSVSLFSGMAERRKPAVMQNNLSVTSQLRS